ncbi:hypothetical protein E9536_40905 [Burkholderia sp. LS-044]|uniref:Ig-like domain-containing protein n=1 Tax=Burkholderia sp. LS-044 TaxID=1459967 RepID=UPI0010A5EFFC|nr:Ig-like domain-containing protein [Burkholderia sp. LS-044]THJ45640.1 hypothetical protein E9536_40905 [Burkholderia sp. LS-044]
MTENFTAIPQLNMTEIGGFASDGDSLWISVSGAGGQSGSVIKYNPKTKATSSFPIAGANRLGELVIAEAIAHHMHTRVVWIYDSEKGNFIRLIPDASTTTATPTFTHPVAANPGFAWDPFEEALWVHAGGMLRKYIRNYSSKADYVASGVSLNATGSAVCYPLQAVIAEQKTLVPAGDLFLHYDPLKADHLCVDPGESITCTLSLPEYAGAYIDWEILTWYGEPFGSNPAKINQTDRLDGNGRATLKFTRSAPALVRVIPSILISNAYIAPPGRDFDILLVVFGRESRHLKELVRRIDLTPKAGQNGELSVTATAINDYGGVVPNVKLTWRANGGVKCNPTDGVTDDQGRTTTRLSGGDSTENLTVTASANGVSGSTSIHYVADETIAGIGIHAISGFRIEAVKGGVPGHASGPLTGAIYGNGRHQVEILVRLDIHGIDGREISGLDVQKLHAKLYLVDLATGKSLDWHQSIDKEKEAGRNAIIYTGEKGEFCPVTDVDVPKGDGNGTYYFPFYVSISGSVPETQVVARLFFDRAQSWIETTGRRSASSSFPNDNASFASISCIDPLDYSLAKNIAFKSGHMWKKTDLDKDPGDIENIRLYVWQKHNFGIETVNYYANVWNMGLSVVAKNFGHKFFKKTVYNAHSFYSNEDGSVLRPKMINNSADIVWSESSNVTIFCVDRESYGYSVGAEFRYIDYVVILKHGWEGEMPHVTFKNETLNREEIRINMVNVGFNPAGSARLDTNYHRIHVDGPPSIEVFDNYGNKGTITIKKGEHWPELLINGELL